MCCASGPESAAKQRAGHECSQPASSTFFSSDKSKPATCSTAASYVTSSYERTALKHRDKDCSYFDLRNRLDLLEVVPISFAHIACRTIILSARTQTFTTAREENERHEPVLWYIGSLMSPTRSYTCAAGKPYS